MPNRPRWDGRAERFYEVWYVIFVDRATGDGFWVRYTLLNPLATDAVAGATLWFGYTSRSDPARNLAVSRTYHAPAFTVRRAPFTIEIAGATFADGALGGGFEVDGRRVAWDLTYPTGGEPHYYFGPRLRRFAERRSSVTLPHPRIEVAGTVTIDGDTRAVRGAGHQAHHWGSERAPRWLWAHCSAFDDDETAILELLAPEVAGGLAPAFVTLHTRARTIACTGAAALVRNRAHAGLGFWQAVGHHGRTRVVADIRVDPRRVLRFVYHSTDLRPSECWNTQVGDCLIRVYDGARLAAVLRAHGTAAAEVHDEDPTRIAYRVWQGGG